MTSVRTGSALLVFCVVLGTASRVFAENKENPEVAKLASEGYWLKDNKEAYEPAMQMLNKPAPPLQLAAWQGTPMTAARLKGKIVLVDFWATWCGPCIAQIPHANEMARKYADKGVLVFGACCPQGSDTMAKTAQEHGMEYPTGKLPEQAPEQWKIRFWPTYAVIDRQGRLRAIGLRPDYVEKVLDALIEEQPADDKAAGDKK